MLAGRLDGYSVLLLPWAYCLSEQVAEAIRAWCAGGGILIAEPYCARRDEHGVAYDEAPGAGLAEVLGVRAGAVTNYHYWLVGHLVEPTDTGSTLLGLDATARFWFAGLREDVELAAGAEPLLMFSDYEPLQRHTPALVLNRYGRGAAVYMAAGVGEAYTKMETPYLRQVVARLLEYLGVCRPVTVEGLADELSQDLEIMLLQSADGRDRTIVAINHGDAAATATFSLAAGSAPRLGLRELITYDSLPLQRAGGRVSLCGTVPPREVRLYHIYALDRG